MRINIEDYNGMCIYAEGVQGFANGFWLDVEELKEFCEKKGIPMPTKVHGCKRESLKLSAYSVIEELEAEYADTIEDGELDDSVKTAVHEWVQSLNQSLEQDHNCHWFVSDESVEVVLEESPTTSSWSKHDERTKKIRDFLPEKYQESLLEIMDYTHTKEDIEKWLNKDVEHSVQGVKPKENKENRGFYFQWECPTCGNYDILQGGHFCNYCDTCGTKIDWSDIQ